MLHDAVSIWHVMFSGNSLNPAPASTTSHLNSNRTFRAYLCKKNSESRSYMVWSSLYDRLSVVKAPRYLSWIRV